MALTQQWLEKHLWRAADILRGRIDSGEYKHYIFGLLFFTRLSDVWYEEYEERLEMYDGAEDLAADPDEHRFHIPEGHFWEDVRQKTTDIGAALNQALHAIEDENMSGRRSSGFAQTHRRGSIRARRSSSGVGTCG